ncbi:MAG TPA: DUF305 domain-containing protein [Thermoanaerobaculia bacterium]
MEGMEKGHYGRLVVMIVLSFVAMYILMYAMVNAFENVIHNINQVYMAALMAASMIPIEIGVMRMMYPDRKRNAIVIAVGIVLLIGSFMGIRRQTAVGDRQFLKSMIPHHAGAILMCEQASISDPRVEALCATIVKSQREEIAEMKALLRTIP